MADARACILISPVTCAAHITSTSVSTHSATKQEKLAAAVTVSVGAMMAHPLMAEAAITPSVKNLLLSVVSGGLVLGVIALGITAIASFDPISRQ